jgi:hypothetical protein
MTGIVYGIGSKIVAVVSILRFLLSRNLWLKAPENRFHVHCFEDLGFCAQGGNMQISRAGWAVLGASVITMYASSPGKEKIELSLSTCRR